MAFKINEDSGTGQLLKAWWADLENDKGGRAALRRAVCVLDVVMTPAYQRLHRRVTVMDQGRWFATDHPYRFDRLAMVAALLAHVRQDDVRTLPQAMSQKTDGSDRCTVSDLRFKRLLESPDNEALFTGLRRVLPLIDRKANVLSLAQDVLNWGDSVKKQWAYAYDWPVKAGH